MTMRYLRGVATLKLDAARCAGCGMCLNVCPHAVFRLESRKAAIADADLCMECGACAGNCPTEAIKVKKGVGCAQAVRKGLLNGTEPECGCGDDSSCC